MPDGTLWIGNKRYSSWSLRGWLAVRLAGLDVEEVVIPFVRDGSGGTHPLMFRFCQRGNQLGMLAGVYLAEYAQRGLQEAGVGLRQERDGNLDRLTRLAGAKQRERPALQRQGPRPTRRSQQHPLSRFRCGLLLQLIHQQL